MNKLLWALLFVATGCNNHSEKVVDQKAAPVVAQDSTPTPGFLVKHPLISLLRKTPVEIGCMLQTVFNYRDSVFNCDNRNYVNKGDPCKKTVEYYEGIKISDELAQKIDPSFKKIELFFEHGSLQHMTVTFWDSVLITKIRETFNLPLKGSYPQNIIDIDYGENTFSADKPVNENYTRLFSITGFDHIGAGDADCK